MSGFMSRKRQFGSLPVGKVNKFRRNLKEKEFFATSRSRPITEARKPETKEASVARGMFKMQKFFERVDINLGFGTP